MFVKPGGRDGTTSVLLNLSAGRPFGVCRCVGQCADNGGAFELLQIERASFQNPEALELARAARSHRRFEELLSRTFVLSFATDQDPRKQNACKDLRPTTRSKSEGFAILQTPQEVPGGDGLGCCSSQTRDPCQDIFRPCCRTIAAPPRMSTLDWEQLKALVAKVPPYTLPCSRRRL